ncbi:MAG: segregation and condensation protein A [Alphaproteobacteria bacterium]
MADQTSNITLFEPPSPGGGERLVLNIDGFEGPLDVLLALARNQKIDLAEISILQLSEQYLEFIAEARKVRLELAADYLVMAAWLAYLKSRLLLPEENDDEEPSGDELAAQLAFRLQRLEAMRARAAELMSRHRVGRDVFMRGQPEGIRLIRKSAYIGDLYELLRAYAAQNARAKVSELRISRTPVFSMDDALARLEQLVGHVPEWTSLIQFLPESIKDTGLWRSAVASTFAASLEYARQGKIELQQSQPFGQLMMRTKTSKKDGET